MISRFLDRFAHRCSISYWARPAPSSRLARKRAIWVSSAQYFPITALVAIALIVACSSERQAKIEGIWVAQADGLEVAAEGPTVAITPGLEFELPEGDIVRLAIDRKVIWSEVRALRKRIFDAGKTPVLMVASDRKTGALELYDELVGDPINVFVTVEGKLCVGPPGSRKTKCVQRQDRRHVDRSFTRELVREAVGAYKLDDVLIAVPPDIEWADVVRAVDGARTCCYEKKVRVRLKR